MNFMDLPIDDKELDTILYALGVGGNVQLYQKLKLVRDLKKEGLPYKKILREKYGVVI